MTQDEDNENIEHDVENSNEQSHSRAKTTSHKLDRKDYLAFFIAAIQTIFLPLILVLIALTVLVALIVGLI
jgi:hypothetical protein